MERRDIIKSIFFFLSPFRRRKQNTAYPAWLTSYSNILSWSYSSNHTKNAEKGITTWRVTKALSAYPVGIPDRNAEYVRAMVPPIDPGYKRVSIDIEVFPGMIIVQCEDIYKEYDIGGTGG